MNGECLIRILRCGLILVVSQWFASAAYANQTSGSPWQPDNWYQAEVLIFTQGSAVPDEAASLQYQLKYPQRWLRLLDSDTVIDIRQLADAFEDGIDPDDAGALKRISIQSNLPQTTAASDASAALIPGAPVPSALIAGPLIAAKPIFELPYRRLKAPDRNLNDTARALVRRPPYEVIYHRAWRFPAQQDSDDPWLIVEGGPAFKDRFQLEGSLRFYKSRFLHFESNLWLIHFSDDIEATQQITLPVLKRHPRSKKSPIVDQTSGLAGLEKAPATAHDPNVESAIQSPDNGGNRAEAQADTDVYGEGDGQDLPQISSALTSALTSVLTSAPAMGIGELSFGPRQPGAQLEPAIESLASPNVYPAKNLWTFNQSRRLQEAEVYYLDHPQIGIILTIKAYQPQLLNPQDNQQDKAPITE
jgi:hypothetical protein